MKKLLFSSVLLLSGLALLAESDSLVMSRLNRMAETLSMPEIEKGEVKIRFPQVEGTYRLELKGTDKLPVVDAAGNIGKPLTTQNVSLYFLLTDVASGVKKEITNLTVSIPGERASDVDTNSYPAVIPSLREWVGGNSEFNFKGTGRIVIDPTYASELREGAQLLAADLKELGNWLYEVREGQPGEGDVYMTLATTDRQLGEEGYRLMIDAGGIKIEAPAVRGAFWGTRTLLQMLQNQGMQLAGGIARDYPKYARRGFMLDVARKFIRLEFLQTYVKIMSYYKMNEFHIHLNDNGFVQYFDNDWDKTYAAFRLESETFPGLTAKDGHYTKKEFTALQRQGMAYGVNVLPEIDVPAHSLAFSHYRKSLGSEKYGMDHLDLFNPAVYPFLDSLFREYLEGPEPVFMGPEVHIGTDEYAKEAAEEFRAFTDHYLRYVQSFGKRARMWGALTHAKGKTPVTSEGVIVNAWYNGYGDPKEMIEQGYDLISTPDGYLYIVPAAGYYYNYLNTKYLYETWEPIRIGDQTFPMGMPQILGGTFTLWNDHCGNGITEKDIHHRVFPALQVLSEKMWTGARAGNNYEVFNRLASASMEAPGVNMMANVASVGDTVLNYKPGLRGIKDLSGNGYDAVKTERVKITKADGMVFEGTSVVVLPVPEIGYNYTVSFGLYLDTANPVDAILFKSPHAEVVLNESGSGKLAFRREGYCYAFDYTVQPGEWVDLAIQGDNKGTALYVNGKLVQRLEGKTSVVKDKRGKESTLYIQQTLVFPLQHIGDAENGFKGKIRSLKIVKHNTRVWETPENQ